VARYLGEERTRESFAKLRPRPGASTSHAGGRGDFELLQYAEYLLAFSDRRGVIAAGAVAVLRSARSRPKSAEASRRRQRRDPLQSRKSCQTRARSRAAGHRGVRQGAGAGLLEPAIRRHLPILPHEIDPRRYRARTIFLATSPSMASQRHERRRVYRPRARRQIRLRRRGRSSNASAERGFGDRSLRSNRIAGRRASYDLHRHQPPSVKAAEGAGARQCDAEPPRARAHRRTHPAQMPSSRRGESGSRRRPTLSKDAVASPRRATNPAANASTPPRLYVHQPDRAPARIAAIPILVANIDASLRKRSKKSSPRCWTFPARHGAIAAGICRFRIDELPCHRARVSNLPPLGREKGLRILTFHCRVRRHIRSDRRLLRRLLQNLISNAIKYTPAGAFWSGCRRPRRSAFASKSTTPASGIRTPNAAPCSRKFHRLDQGARVARRRGPWTVDRRRIGAGAPIAR